MFGYIILFKLYIIVIFIINSNLLDKNNKTSYNYYYY